MVIFYFFNFFFILCILKIENKNNGTHLHLTQEKANSCCSAIISDGGTSMKRLWRSLDEKIMVLPGVHDGSHVERYRPEPTQEPVIRFHILERIFQ